jgi:hypothetical protein
MGMDASDRFEPAWGAIVECLYAADEPPSRLDLLRAGSRGLSRLRAGVLRERGYAGRRDGSGRDPAAGPMTARSFWRYWHSPVPPGPEERATERAAVRQVMAALEPLHAAALLALAEHGDRAGAAAALGVTAGTFGERLREARAAFFVLWHDREAPSRMWRLDSCPRRRFLRSDAADPAGVLADVIGAFGDRTRVASADLLARLAAADPGRYGGWDVRDLNGLLRWCGVTPHRINVDGDRSDKRQGHWLEDITAALGQLAAGTPPGLAA